MSRDDLIARKESVRAELARTRRELEHARTAFETACGLRRRFLGGCIAQLDARTETLMAEEYRLRLQIDQAR